MSNSLLSYLLLTRVRLKSRSALQSRKYGSSQRIVWPSIVLTSKHAALPVVQHADCRHCTILSNF